MAKLSDDDLEKSSSYAFKPLVFVTAFFHAIIQDRRKYGKIGWNVNYDFSESDFKISYELINLYLTKTLENNEDTIPWTTIKYLIGDCMYGGKCTDDNDRIVLLTYLDEYMGDFLFDKNREFFFSKSKEFNY